jgi:hypothetical protein
MTTATQRKADSLHSRPALRTVAGLCFGMLFLVSSAHAGQVYGSVVSGGRAVSNTAVEINCGGAKTTSTTAPDGRFRINVPQQGQCTLSLPSFPGAAAAVFSYPNPSQYDFELVGPVNGAYSLHRRS